MAHLHPLRVNRDGYSVSTLSRAVSDVTGAADRALHGRTWVRTIRPVGGVQDARSPESPH
jgi:hypothetical protein